MAEEGLSEIEAKKKLEEYGRNEITRNRKSSPLKILLSQFTSPLIIILIAAAIISVGIGFVPGQDSDIIDAVLIIIIVIASGILGFMQDYKAEKTIETLRKMSSPKARVVRDGKAIEIDSALIVPGDLILIESGDIIPADAKIIESSNLQIDESVLTGESGAVKKSAGDAIFMNSFVSVGSAKAIVTQTGMNAKMGKIAGKLEEMNETETPFQVELKVFSKKIFWGILALTIIIMLVSMLKYPFYESILTAISLAVAAIPEGLPAVVTLALAIGAKSMSGKNALIRKLAVTESIGSVDIICTDKTGTLTKNEMTVTKIYANGSVFDTHNMKKEDTGGIENLFRCAALCNNVKKGYDDKGKEKYLGDQTEVAVVKLSEILGFSKEELSKTNKKIDEISFTSKRKMMSIVVEKKGKNIIYSKGAPEILVEKCNRIYKNGKIKLIEKDDKKEILAQNTEFASHALRVLGFAYKEKTSESEETEENLIWIGLMAMIDPPREEVKEALKNCTSAGIKVVMLTGDNPSTAKAIADEIGLKNKGVIEEIKIESMSDEELNKKLQEGWNIFARVSPFHKLRILELLSKKYRVAMTGDGVNDALALKKADVGVAMGLRGTDVAKEASDMILLDDNFATIISAIKEGRRIFDNIRKFVNYLLSCNIAEVLVIFLATIFLTLKDPILLPVHILWINLMTDGLPALALGVDPADSDIMKRKARKKGSPLLDKRLSLNTISSGILLTLMLFATFFFVLPAGLDKARTALFTGFVIYEFVRIGSVRYQDKLNMFSNKWLLLTVGGSIILQLAILYTPLNVFFKIVPLGLYEWAVLIAGVIIGYLLSILSTKLILKYVK